jgi:N-acetylglucosamine kinase-like BadF-type ATPase
MMVKDLFIQLMNIDEEAKNILRDAKNETGASIMRLKEEAESELDAIKKTTDLIEQQKKSTNLSKINELRNETEKAKAERLGQLKKIVEKNWNKAMEYGLQLMDKIK